MGVEGLFANWRFAIRYETYYKIIIIKEIKKTYVTFCSCTLTRFINKNGYLVELKSVHQHFLQFVYILKLGLYTAALNLLPLYPMVLILDGNTLRTHETFEKVKTVDLNKWLKLISLYACASISGLPSYISPLPSPP